ncbi:T9SS type A sorting domain-containing protein [uncultured Kordia sp.]|uniref:T9SS type A sorting domain-containing protein n=1 Tax=uncultured Kordia sp. TaxID=507699 RepID=UPI00261FA3F0|nr:T9SS type A sorting domain-containing protein [uncultured Kordia sp.]
MKKTHNLIITSFVWMCFIISGYAQFNPIVNPIINNNGVVTFDVEKAGNNTHVFTIFGDGTFSTQNEPTHIFDHHPNGLTYTNEMYFAKAYDPHLPPKRIVQITPNNITGNPNTQLNPIINMTGNIDLMTSWATASGYQNFYIIAFKNTTSQTISNGFIEFSYNTDDIQVDTSEIKVLQGWASQQAQPSSILSTGHYNQKLTWSFTSLDVDEVRYIYVPATTLRMVGDKLDLEVKYAANGIETTSQKKLITRRYPHDPNFKIVNKDCIKASLNDQQELVYTVGFFNDGENYAKDVYVKDILQSSLVGDKIAVIDYEVQPTWHEERGSAFFNFLNINLPGTNQIIPGTYQTRPIEYSYDQASTYFSFKICTKTNLTDCILNTASIVFDSQPIFYTNTSKICITVDCMDYDICGEHNRSQTQLPLQLIQPIESDDLDFNIYPNPASSEVNIQINFNTKKTSEFSIELRDYSGKIIEELFINQHDSTIFKKSFNIQHMPSGLYFMTLKTSESQHTKKIIKY